jgi:hypothetical protein
VEASQFDDLTRVIAESKSRRAVLRSLVGAAAGGALAILGAVVPVAAKNQAANPHHNGANGHARGGAGSGDPRRGGGPGGKRGAGGEKSSRRAAGDTQQAAVQPRDGTVQSTETRQARTAVSSCFQKGKRCRYGEQCCSGQCRRGQCTGCPSGKTACGGACVDTPTSLAHCGGCEQPCGTACANGACLACAKDGDCPAPSAGSATCTDGSCSSSCDNASDHLCGDSPGACQTCCDDTHCAAGQECKQGTCTCTATSCNGCCDGDTCKAGDSDGFCGAGGGQCVQCADGQDCHQGACLCDGQSCNGCCDGTTCRTGNADSACGANGGVCGQCGDGETCRNGSCQPVCVPNCQGKTCGSDGCSGSCGTCPVGKSCSNGTCVGCSSDDECLDAGPCEQAFCEPDPRTFRGRCTYPKIPGCCVTNGDCRLAPCDVSVVCSNNTCVHTSACFGCNVCDPITGGCKPNCPQCQYCGPGGICKADPDKQRQPCTRPGNIAGTCDNGTCGCTPDGELSDQECADCCGHYCKIAFGGLYCASSPGFRSLPVWTKPGWVLRPSLVHGSPSPSE